MVDRIRMHHFGTGLVSTPDDFGISGSPPMHPELLDWLATEFVESGWSVKHMHRLIMTSTTWRQQSRVGGAHRATCEAIDPGNQLLWRQSMRRLEAEALRDSLLAVSGTLNETHFGGSMAVARQKDGEVIVHNAADQNRRSVYMQTLRLNPETMLQAFDQPAMSVNCMQRSTSTVSTQAITLLNSDMMTRCAAAFADRVLKEKSDAPIPHAVLTAFARPAAATGETAILSAFFERQASQYLSEQDQSKRNDPDIIKATRTQAMADLVIC
jgi:hypothetical protein